MNIQNRLLKSSLIKSLLIVPALALFSAQAVLAEGLIAVVDLQRAVLQTERAQKDLEQLKEQDDFKENLKNYEQLGKEYRLIAEKYAKDRAVMSAEKREEEERRLIDKEQDLKYLGGKLQQAQKEWGEKIMKEVGPDVQLVLENLVKEQKIELLLRAAPAVVLHVGASYDITDQVTERLNAAK